MCWGAPARAWCHLRARQRRDCGPPRAGSPTFKAVVERAKGVVLDAVANADIPFHQVVDAAAVARSAAYTPVFQTQLTLEGWAGEPGAAGGEAQGRMGDLAAEPLPVPPPLLSANLEAEPLSMHNDAWGCAGSAVTALWLAGTPARAHASAKASFRSAACACFFRCRPAGWHQQPACLRSMSSPNETPLVCVGRSAAARRRWTLRWTCMRRSTPSPAAWNTPRTCLTAAPWSA